MIPRCAHEVLDSSQDHLRKFAVSPSGQNRIGNSIIGHRGTIDVPASSDGVFDGNVSGPPELARLVRHAEGVYIYPVFVYDITRKSAVVDIVKVSTFVGSGESSVSHGQYHSRPSIDTVFTWRSLRSLHRL